MKPHRNFPNVFFKKGRRLDVYTKNLTPGQTFFDEDTVRKGEDEFRLWDPFRSKLSAAIHKNISQIGFNAGDKVLYLGASHGYTPSFVSDMVGETGRVFALDFAPRVVRDLVFLTEKRTNIIPVMADANRPSTFAARITSVDVVYQDVAQKNQADIFIKNCMRFLKPGGFGLLAVKSRSIDITRKPKGIYQEIRHQLEKELTVVDYRVLDPLEKDHAMIVVKK